MNNTYLCSVNKEQLLGSVRVVWKMNKIVGRHFSQPLKGGRGDVQTVDVANVFVQSEVTIDLRGKVLNDLVKRKIVM
jgi:hypothetical protein